VDGDRTIDEVEASILAVVHLRTTGEGGA
jgi:hypothetical protein